MVGQWSVNGRSMVSQQSDKFGEIWSKLVKFSHFSLFGQFSQTRASLYLTAFSRIIVWDTKQFVWDTEQIVWDTKQLLG